MIFSKAQIKGNINTSLIDVHPPERSTDDALIAAALPVALALVDEGVCRRWHVPAEAFPTRPIFHYVIAVRLL